MKKIILLIVFLSFTLYSGCATIFSGSNSEILLESNPQGAKVLVNGNSEGKTPLTINLKKGKEYVIDFVKDGFQKKSIRMSYGIAAGWLILDIFAGLLGVIIDAATGNWNNFDFDFYKANLDTLN